MIDHQVEKDHIKDAAMSKFYLLVISLCICLVSLEEGWAQMNDCKELNIYSEISQPSCGILNDGVIKLRVSGGQEPYAYEWSDGSRAKEINVSEGDYFVRVTDSNGCKLTKSFSLESRHKLQLKVTTTNPTTLQATDGRIQCDFIGGTAPYQLQVSHYTNNTSPRKYSTDQPILDKLGNGRYILDVIDAKGCVSTAIVVLSSQNQ